MKYAVIFYVKKSAHPVRSSGPTPCEARGLLRALLGNEWPGSGGMSHISTGFFMGKSPDLWSGLFTNGGYFAKNGYFQRRFSDFSEYLSQKGHLYGQETYL